MSITNYDNGDPTNAGNPGGSPGSDYNPDYHGSGGYNPTTSYTPTTTSGEPGATITPAGTATGGGYGGIDPSSIIFDTDGTVYFYKRQYDSQTGQTNYAWTNVGNATTSGWDQISAAMGVPTGWLQEQYSQWQNTQGQTQRQQTQMGQYTMVGKNPDGSYAVRDFYGALHSVAPADIGSTPGVAASDITDANTAFTRNQQTTTQAGQSQVVGYNPDGTYAVRDYYGNITNLSAADTAALSGVTSAQMRSAVQDYQSQTTSGNAFGSGQVVSANQDGTVNIRKGDGTYVSMSATDALGIPGVTSGAILNAQNQYHQNQLDANEISYQSGQFNPNPASGLGTYSTSSLTTPNATATAAPTGTATNSTGSTLATPSTQPTAQPSGATSTGQLPGATPSPAPTVAAHPAAGATNTGSPSAGGINTTGMTVQQAQQAAQTAQTAATLSEAGKYRNITYAGGGQYSGQNFYGAVGNISSATALGTQSASQADLDVARQRWQQQQHQQYLATAASTSHVYDGFDPNSIKGSIAGQ